MFDLRELDRRIIEDRRQRSTPCLSQYIFSGRRRTFRRNVGQNKGGYVDRYDMELLLLVVLIAGLNLLDSVFTKTILAHGGWELNPVVRAANELWGDSIWTWKVVAIPGFLCFLYIHSKFRWVETFIRVISCVYGAVVLYEILIYFWLVGG